MLFGDCILSMHAFLTQLADLTTPAAPPAAELFALHEIVATCTLQYFGAARRELATSQFLLDGVRAAARAGITPDQLQQLAAEFGQEREADLAHVAQIFQERTRAWQSHPSIALVPAAVQRLAQRTSLPWQQITIDIAPLPHAAWPVLQRALVAHGVPLIRPSPERERNTTAPITRYSAPNLVAEARHIADTLRTLRDAGVSGNALALVLLGPAQAALFRQALFAVGLCRHAVAPSVQTPSARLQQLLHPQVWCDTPTAQSVSAWLGWLATHMTAHDATTQRARQIHHDPLAAFAARALRDTIAWHDIWRSWAGFCARHPEQQLTREIFRALVRTLIRPSAPIADLADDCEILVTTLDDVPQQPLHTVFLPGCTEQALPRLGRHTFFSRLPTAGDHFPLQQLHAAFPRPDARLTADTDLLRRLRARTEHFVATFTESDVSGRPVFPSHLLTATLAPEIESIGERFFCPDAPMRRCTENKYSVAVRAARELALRRDVQNPESGALLLTDPAVRAHVAARYRDHRFSVTELQKFLECPFAFYAEYLLGLRLPIEDELSVTPRTQGELVHLALSRLYQSQRDALLALAHTTDDATSIIASLIAQVIQTVRVDCQAALGHHHPLLQALSLAHTAHMVQQCVHGDLALWRTHGDNAFLPTACEWRFGDESPVILRSPETDAQIAVHGTIDRIDVNERRREFIVIDYKTGKTTSIIGELNKGRHLQLPIYLHAAAQAWRGYAPVGGLLLHLKSATRKHGLVRREIGKAWLGIAGTTKSSMKDDAWDDTLRTALQSAIAAAQKMQCGDIPLTAHTCEHCDWLGFSRHEVAS